MWDIQPIWWDFYLIYEIWDIPIYEIFLLIPSHVPNDPQVDSICYNLEYIVKYHCFNWFSNFEGRGISEGMKQWIRNYTKLERIPQLAHTYPIFNGCTWDFQGTYKKLMGTLDRINDVWKDIISKKMKEKICWWFNKKWIWK